MNDEKFRIVERLLLSSPPGQFQQIVSTLQFISEDSTNTGDARPFLTRESVQQIQNEYNSNTGREVLAAAPRKSDDDKDVMNTESTGDDDFGNQLKRALKKYLEKHYSSKGVESNFVLNASDSNNDDDDDDDGSSYDIILYAERIKLKQYHAGSWVARYTIVNSSRKATKNSGTTMDGIVKIHAHSFENGNVQIQSETKLPTARIESTTSVVENIVDQIQKWDEEYVLQPLHGVYNDMSADILKKMRRVMPVTRTRFDWNVEGHRFVKAVSSDMRGKH